MAPDFTTNEDGATPANPAFSARAMPRGAGNSLPNAVSNSITSQIKVQGTFCSVTDLNVFLKFSKCEGAVRNDGTCACRATNSCTNSDDTFPNDLRISLRGPDGTEVRLVNPSVDDLNGDENANDATWGANFSPPIENVAVTFDQSAPGTPGQLGQVVPQPGTFQPKQDLSVFNGLDANDGLQGWTLLFGNVGSSPAALVEWGLDVTCGPVNVDRPGRARPDTGFAVTSGPTLASVNGQSVEATLNIQGDVCIIANLDNAIVKLSACAGGPVRPGGTCASAANPPATSPSDIRITLVAPDGTEARLVSSSQDGSPTWSKTDAGPIQNVPIAFDQAAITAIGSSNPSQPTAGTFRPVGDLGVFKGRDANGAWTLRFDDVAGNGASAALLEWSISVACKPAFFTADTGPIANFLVPEFSEQSFPLTPADVPSCAIGRLSVTAVITACNSASTVQPDGTCSNSGLGAFPADLLLKLRAPDGTEATLVEFGFNEELGPYENVAVTFSDAAGGPVFGPLVPGQFQPQQELAAFVGKAAGGTWQLVASDGGTSPAPIAIMSWSLSASCLGALEPTCRAGAHIGGIDGVQSPAGPVFFGPKPGVLVTDPATGGWPDQCAKRFDACQSQAAEQTLLDPNCGCELWTCLQPVPRGGAAQPPACASAVHPLKDFYCGALKATMGEGFQCPGNFIPLPATLAECGEFF